MEDVPIFLNKKRPPLARPEDFGDELLLRNTASNSGKNASLTPTPDEEILEEMVKFYLVFVSFERMFCIFNYYFIYF